MAKATLYSPCYAAHAPTKLRHISANKIATSILSYCLPKQLREQSSWDYVETSHNKLELDNIIMGLGKDDENIQFRQENLKKRLHHAQVWWNTTNWFGPPCSYIKRIVQDGMSRTIDQFDAYFQCPLMKFTLQVLFTREAGAFNASINQVNLELPKNNCERFLNFLTGFDKFHIESLVNTSIVFAAPNALVHVLLNSPYMKKVHLRYNCSDYVVQKLARRKELEVFICNDFYGACLISVNCFYKTFFSGMTREEILDLYNRGVKIDPTFPNLKYVDIGKSSAVEEFLGTLQFFYRNLRSLSCKSVNFTATKISNLPRAPFSKSIAFTIHDISLTAHCILKFERKRSLALLPNIKHVTLCIDQIHDTQIDEFRDKTKEFLAYLRYFSLTLAISFDSVSDKTIEDIFLPIFHLLGTNITALQFDLKVLGRIKTYWALTNACFNLNVFTLTISEAISIKSTYGAKLNTMSSLKSLSLTLSEVAESEVTIAHTILDQIIGAAPNIQTLELVLPSNLTDWIMTVAAKGLLKHVRTLILKITPYNFLPDVDFYVPVVEAMSDLSNLVLLKVPGVILAHMRRIFQNSEFKVSYGKVRIVAYHGVGLII